MRRGRTGYHKSYVELHRRPTERLSHVFSLFGGNHPTFHPDQIVPESTIGAV